MRDFSSLAPPAASVARRGKVRFAALQPEDLLSIDRQASQHLWLGLPGDIDWEQAALLAGQPVAFCARRADGSILACFGINETFDDVQGVAWALLSDPIGRDHLALTRFIREVVASSGYRRIELLAKARESEHDFAFARSHGLMLDTTMMVNVAMAEPTPECRWAVLLGFTPAHVLRQFGAASETYMLFEHIRAAVQ